MMRRFIEYGDFSEKKATMISQLLIENKANELLKTTTGLTTLLQKEIKITRHELAPVFQCIRIITNNEF